MDIARLGSEMSPGSTRNGPKLVILGKQGAGKGTQCVRLARHYVVPHVSTGDMFRAVQWSGSQLGNRLKSILDKGELVPDNLTIEVVAERLEQDSTRTRGFVLDGFPRTAQQAEALDRMLRPSKVDLAIDLEIPTELAIERLSGRRICQDCQAIYGPAYPTRVPNICDNCGGSVVQRDDDTDEAIRRRLSLYAASTEPILDWYRERDLLITVDGVGTTDEITDRLVAVVDEAVGRSGAMFTERGAS